MTFNIFKIIYFKHKEVCLQKLFQIKLIDNLCQI